MVVKAYFFIPKFKEAVVTERTASPIAGSAGHQVGITIPARNASRPARPVNVCQNIPTI
jgi:hypothetical protein